MTRVCLIGKDGTDLEVELLASETARDALASYDLTEPFENTVAIETISIGAAVSILNDLNWYLVRLVTDAIVLEPSVSGTEWLSRDLATAIRNEVVDPGETGTYLKVYGVDPADPIDEGDGEPVSEEGSPRLTAPMFAQRVDGTIPSYDLADVSDTLVVRVTENEFGTS